MQKRKYWNLMEAAAWVMYRDMKIVDRFAPPRPHHWGAFIMFPPKKGGDTGGRQDEGDVKDKGDATDKGDAKDPSNEGEESKVQVGDKDKVNHDEQLETSKSNANPIESFAPYRELFDALRSGDLQAYGRHGEQAPRAEPIPAFEWQDLVEDPAGPYRRSRSWAMEFPWQNITVARADVERHWRRPSETLGRTRHPWPYLQQIFAELRSRHPDLSQNELIDELQREYHDRTDRDAPSRTSIQRHLKSW